MPWRRNFRRKYNHESEEDDSEGFVDPEASESEDQEDSQGSDSQDTEECPEVISNQEERSALRRQPPPPLEPLTNSKKQRLLELVLHLHHAVEGLGDTPLLNEKQLQLLSTKLLYPLLVVSPILRQSSKVQTIINTLEGRLQSKASTSEATSVEPVQTQWSQTA